MLFRSTVDRKKVRGFYRLMLGEDKGHKVKIVGDTGWLENTVTNDGLDNYIAATVGKVAGSKQFEYMQLATQTDVVGATQAALVGETRVRKSVSPSVIATGTFQATALWSSTDNTAQVTIGAIGLYNTSSGGSLGAGQTFTTSAWASNQNVSASYQIRFA